jgi:hypothetical protein
MHNVHAAKLRQFGADFRAGVCNAIVPDPDPIPEPKA